MSKAIKSKPSPTISRADELRQEKQNKLDDNNRKVSKQLEKSAEKWQNSMEQVRKISKKTQDSSQIFDNVFTENENDRSEIIDIDRPKSGKSIIGERQFFPHNSFQSLSEPSFRPMSQYANISTNPFTQYLQNRAESSLFRDSRVHFNQENQHFYGYQPQNIPPTQRFSQNQYSQQNINQYNQNIPTLSKFSQYNNHPFYQYSQPNINQYNHNIPPTQRFSQNQYSQRNINQTNQNSYQPRIPFYNYNRPIGMPYNSFQNIRMGLPNLYPPSTLYNPYFIPQNHPREEVSSMESMKKYLTSLLDKLEILNDTVAKLKSENENSNHQIQRNFLRSNSQNSVKYNRDFVPQNSEHCYGFRHPVSHTALSCSCRDIRRPSSSINRPPPHIHTPACFQQENILPKPSLERSHTSCSNHNVHRSHMDGQNPNLNGSHRNCPSCNPSAKGFENKSYLERPSIESIHRRNFEKFNNITQDSTINLEHSPFPAARLNFPQSRQRSLSRLNTVDRSATNTVTNVNTEFVKRIDLGHPTEPYSMPM